MIFKFLDYFGELYRSEAEELQVTMAMKQSHFPLTGFAFQISNVQVSSKIREFIGRIKFLVEPGRFVFFRKSCSWSVFVPSHSGIINHQKLSDQSIKMWISITKRFQIRVSKWFKMWLSITKALRVPNVAPLDKNSCWKNLSWESKVPPLQSYPSNK